MGLFSFLFGGGKAKTKPAAKAAAAKPAVADKAPVTATAMAVAYAPVSATAGVAQAKLRLKLVASLRSGDHPTAYEAAQGLADIQVRAGRKTVARVWQRQAERIKADAGLSA
jgi:hypothetical protein